MLSFEQVEELLAEFKDHVGDDSDMSYVDGGSPAEMRAEIEKWLTALRNKSIIGLPHDINGFMPLFEHAKLNGWNEEFWRIFEQYMRWYEIKG